MIRLLRPDDFRVMPWKNGLGSTTEIAREPVEGEAFDWRISIADVVSDGPFSRFEEIDRVILTIEGAGMELRHGATAVTLQPFETYTFAGERETYCSLLSGSIRDFNVMTRRGIVSAQVTVERASFISPATLLYCVCGNAVAEGAGEKIQLHAGEAVRAENDESFVVELPPLDAVVIVVSFSKG